MSRMDLENILVPFFVNALNEHAHQFYLVHFQKIEGFTSFDDIINGK